MARYLMADGSFDGVHGAYADRTVHTLDFGGRVRLYLDLSDPRADNGLPTLAAARASDDARLLSGFRLLEQELEPLANRVDVMACFRDRTGVAYQRRAHVAFPGGVGTFTIRGPLGRRSEIDACLDATLETARLRPGDAPAPTDPGVYVTNVLSFTPATAGFVDRTVHDFEAPLSSGAAMGLVIGHAAPPHRTALEEAAREHVEQQSRTLPFHQVVATERRSICGAPAIEVEATWAYRGRGQHLRELYVDGSRSRLAFSTTAPLEHRKICDERFSQVISTLSL